MKVKLIADNISWNSMKDRTVQIAVGIVEDRWLLGAWAEQPDKKLEPDRGMTQESLVLSDQR